MNAHKIDKLWCSFVAKDYITSLNYLLSSVAMDIGMDGNGLQLEKIRLNFSNSSSVLTLNQY